jgi:hypothetical protein
MASAKATIDLATPVDEVWDLIGGFGSLSDWLPGISKIYLTAGGRVRHIETVDGQRFIERLESYDRNARNYSYSILQSAFEVTDYRASLTVSAGDNGRGSHIEWGATFTPKNLNDEVAEKSFQDTFSGGLKALASRYAVA